MLTWLKELDRILRGQATRREVLSSGTVEFPIRGLSAVILVLGMFYGLCMGTFAVVSGRGGGWPQMVAAMFKVPALFFLTLAVTFPSLYVFNALVGSRLTLVSVLRLIVAAMAVMLALLASFGTIVAFFSFTTESYSFMVLLNVVIFTFAALPGLGFLLQTLHRLTLVQEDLERTAQPAPPRPAEELPAGAAAESATEVAEPGLQSPSSRVASIYAARAQTSGAYPAGALERLSERPPDRVKTVFRIWIIMFALVGTQMSWVLRPFIGGGADFHVFRPKGSNFFEAVLNNLKHLFS